MAKAKSCLIFSRLSYSEDSRRELDGAHHSGQERLDSLRKRRRSSCTVLVVAGENRLKTGDYKMKQGDTSTTSTTAVTVSLRLATHVAGAVSADVAKPDYRCDGTRNAAFLHTAISRAPWTSVQMDAQTFRQSHTSLTAGSRTCVRHRRHRSSRSFVGYQKVKHRPVNNNHKTPACQAWGIEIRVLGQRGSRHTSLSAPPWTRTQIRGESACRRIRRARQEHNWFLRLLGPARLW